MGRLKEVTDWLIASVTEKEEDKKYCHVCKYKLDPMRNKPHPPFCPICGANLLDISEEILRDAVRCLQAGLSRLSYSGGLGEGVLFATNKRLFFIVNDTVGEHEDNYTHRGPMFKTELQIYKSHKTKMTFNAPLGTITRVEELNKTFDKGAVLYTDNGESFNFTVKLGFGIKPQQLIDFLVPFVSR